MSEKRINLHNEQTPCGEYREDLVYDKGGLYKTKYRYYVSKAIDKTAYGLCRNGNFVLDKVVRDKVELYNPYNNVKADLWTDTNEVEIWSKQKVSLVRD